MMDEPEDTDDWADYETGPFCRHFGQLGACDEECLCGHTCSKHDNADGTCNDSDCDCEKWEEAE